MARYTPGNANWGCQRVAPRCTPYTENSIWKESLTSIGPYGESILRLSLIFKDDFKGLLSHSLDLLSRLNLSNSS